MGISLNVKFPTFELVCGGMFSQKSTFALNRLNLESRRCKTAYFKTTLAEIDGNIRAYEFKTHDGLIYKGPSFEVSRFWKPNLSGYDFCVIDEVQFFDTGYVEIFREWVEREHKSLLLVGLDLDFKGKPFETCSFLAMVVDSVVKLSSVCSVCGRPSTYSRKTGDSTMRFQEGGAELYQPVCRNCFRV